jgi:hypothetical protein
VQYGNYFLVPASTNYKEIRHVETPWPKLPLNEQSRFNDCHAAMSSNSPPRKRWSFAACRIYEMNICDPRR